MRLFLLTLLIVAKSFAAPEPHTIYLVGEERTMAPNGTLLQSAVYVGKRDHNPAQSLIDVDILYIRKDKANRSHLTRKRVSGNRFRIADPGGAFTGQGELFGEEWKWNRWTYELTFLDGGTMKGEDTLDENRLLMKKEFFAAGGAPRQTVTGNFSVVSRETYEILASKLPIPAE